jgi:hypothetical protein
MVSIASRKQSPSSIIAHPDEEKSYKFQAVEDLQIKSRPDTTRVLPWRKKSSL